jgi:hypothetical protein
MNRKKLVGMAAAIAAGAVLAVSGGGAASAEEPVPHLQPLLQLKVPNAGHFFTANLTEESNAIVKHGFKQTVPGTGFVSPTQYKNLLVPLYRCKATFSEAWLLTLDLKEVDASSKYAGQFNCDATDESGHSQGHPAIIGWVSAKKAPGLAELLRMNNGVDSMIVLNGAEGPWVQRGYKVDGSLGYVYSPKATDPVPALALWKKDNFGPGIQYTLDGADADNAITQHGLEIAPLYLGYWRRVKFAEADHELYRYTMNNSISSIIVNDRNDIEGKPEWKAAFHYDGPVGWVASKPGPGLIQLNRWHLKDKPVWFVGPAVNEDEVVKAGFEKDGPLGYVWAEYPIQQPAGQPVKPPSAAPSTAPSATPGKPGLPKTGVLAQVG